MVCQALWIKAVSSVQKKTCFFLWFSYQGCVSRIVSVRVRFQAAVTNHRLVGSTLQAVDETPRSPGIGIQVHNTVHCCIPGIFFHRIITPNIDILKMLLYRLYSSKLEIDSCVMKLCKISKCHHNSFINSTYQSSSHQYVRKVLLSRGMNDGKTE